MTPAGNIVILAIIASLNAVWGYPLVGLLASFVVLMGCCAIANWMFRPRLDATMRVPELVSSHSVVDVSIAIENPASLPAFDLTLSLIELPCGWKLKSAPRLVSELDRNATSTVQFKVQVAGRGDFHWPTLKCESVFPFSLFRSQQRIGFASSGHCHGGRTLVTPEIVESHITGAVESLLTRGHQAGGLGAGESLEYLGSRDYNHGDFVRRWDFAAWARLGRPIVRQFDQNSVGDLVIVVDTFLQVNSGSSPQADLETRLSLAASIIDSLKSTACNIELILPTAENVVSVRAESTMQNHLLRPLATVNGIRTSDSRHRIVSQTVWSTIAELIDTCAPLVCIMAAQPVTKGDYSSVDPHRQRFLDRVAFMETALVVDPGAESRSRQLLGASHD